MAAGQVYTISGSGSPNLDGEFAFLRLNGDGNAVYAKVVGGTTYYLCAEYTSYQWPTWPPGSNPVCIATSYTEPNTHLVYNATVDYTDDENGEPGDAPAGSWYDSSTGLPVAGMAGALSTPGLRAIAVVDAAAAGFRRRRRTTAARRARLDFVGLAGVWSEAVVEEIPAAGVSSDFTITGFVRRKRPTPRQLSRLEWIPGPEAWGPRRRHFDLRGKYRIFNAAEYRFYRSNSGPPLESDTPFATSATLPHTPADTFADGTWWLSVSRFNGVLDSGFLPLGPRGETFVRLDISGEMATGSPPAGPLTWRIEARAGGTIGVVACYFETGALRAEQWAIAVTSDGSDPAEDAPSLWPSMPDSGLAVLDTTLAAVAHGTTVKVRLQTRRNDGTDASPVWVYSEESTVKTITADATGPTAPLSGERWAGGFEP